ncbi:type III secretion system outer membrane ring subunit SctC [Pseudomonas sp. PDM27]|uniref:type III secretion system outer membrane ring subunit SctC n=1 Tax=Pseudomonas sp. PDM27 TaxID=2854769 RepID=UPI000C9C2D96|nr:type III secretion system outer membrane ring subunit SctC [Pseudomonas sp. PDM27]MBV7568924.1 type III secretion system outer membrane ring subunit SctC [Pseudomonas sp. PDM27]PNB75845.1 EscC/YscC/HrcC family type III secretion system outer membrane ring protein [Pseudomonas sp. GW456-E7]
MNRRLLSLFVLPFWLGALLSLVPLAARANADGYVAREQSVRTFFSELSGPLGKPVIVSKTAAAKRISGAFDLRSPQRTFERVSAQMGLIWYSDGQAMYLYDASEVKSSMMSLQTLTVTRLQAFLERSGLHDARYPLRHDGLRTFHVSGPPMYVDLVVQAAGLMDNQRSELLLGKQQIGVIQVRNTFVSDRKYELRDDKVTIPGLATVIEELLRGEKREVEPSVAQAPAQRPQGLMPAFPLEGLASAPSEQDPTAPRIIAREVAAGNIRVVAYPDTNSLLVKGLPEQVRFIENLVSALDTPKRHVELSLWIIDLHKDELNQLGINWQGALKSSGTFSVSLNAGSATTLDGASFVAQVMALERTNRANVVSRPVILTQENVPAIFDNNRTFYAPLVGERSVDLQHVTYGTLVSVLPRFAQADEIEMSLNIEDGNEVENPDQNKQPGSLPTVGRTRISTVARVPQGKSLLVGGFTRDDHSEQVGRIPVLGSIPWIGRLFSYRQNRSANTVRVFLIQPKEILDTLEPATTDPATRLLTPQQHERVRRSYFRAAEK